MKCSAGYPEHTWIYYHSRGVRWCLDCRLEEELWADFGLTKKEKDDGQPSNETPHGQRPSAPAIEQGS